MGGAQIEAGKKFKEEFKSGKNYAPGTKRSSYSESRRTTRATRDSKAHSSAAASPRQAAGARTRKTCQATVSAAGTAARPLAGWS